MTPAIALLQRRKVNHRVHTYAHDPACKAYGPEAADKLGLPAARVFKTLVVAGGAGRAFVALVPVSASLDLKKLAQAVGAKKVAMADPEVAERLTGYPVGGISPLGQKRRLSAVVDSTASGFQTLFVSAGRRGLELELAPDDLIDLLGGRFANITRI